MLSKASLCFCDDVCVEYLCCMRCRLLGLKSILEFPGNAEALWKKRVLGGFLVEFK